MPAILILWNILTETCLFTHGNPLDSGWSWRCAAAINSKTKSHIDKFPCNPTGHVMSLEIWRAYQILPGKSCHFRWNIPGSYYKGKDHLFWNILQCIVLTAFPNCMQWQDAARILIAPQNISARCKSSSRTFHLRNSFVQHGELRHYLAQEHVKEMVSTYNTRRKFIIRG